jgi:hypothetical protein
MSTGKRHKSPKTGKWEKCTTDACPYGDIPAEAYEKLLPTVKASDLPVARHLVLSRLSTRYDPALHLRTDTKAVETDVPMRVAPAGYTGAACMGCYTYLPEGYAQAFNKPGEGTYGNPDPVPCPNPECTWVLDPEEYVVDVAASDAKYWTDDIAVRRDHWFHVSTRENWLEGATTGGRDGEAILVHVGSKASALDRLRDLMRQDASSYRSDRPAKTYYLYEVEVDASAPINPHVVEDQIDGWPATEKPPRTAAHGPNYVELNAQFQQAYQLDGITRYLNQIEAPGTISLMANAKRLRQVAVHAIPMPSSTTAATDAGTAA